MCLAQLLLWFFTIASHYLLNPNYSGAYFWLFENPIDIPLPSINEFTISFLIGWFCLHVIVLKLPIMHFIPTDSVYSPAPSPNLRQFWTFSKRSLLTVCCLVGLGSMIFDFLLLLWLRWVLQPCRAAVSSYLSYTPFFLFGTHLSGSFGSSKLDLSLQWQTLPVVHSPF